MSSRGESGERKGGGAVLRRVLLGSVVFHVPVGMFHVKKLVIQLSTDYI